MSVTTIHPSHRPSRARHVAGAGLVFAIAVALTATGHAGMRKNCKLACAERVGGECAGGKMGRECRRELLRECRRTAKPFAKRERPNVIREFCAGPRPTTTLSGSGTPTSTITTTTRPPSSTTSTTLPVAYAGSWLFRGELARTEGFLCSPPAEHATYRFQVTHRPGASAISVSDTHSVTMTGTATAAGFEVEHLQLSGYCVFQYFLAAVPTANPDRLEAAVAIAGDCGFGVCWAEWAGAMTR